MKVLKFGGSSLADAQRYMRVTEISTTIHQASGAALVTPFGADKTTAAPLAW